MLILRSAWRHWGCTTNKVLENIKEQFPDPSEIDGFDELQDADKERITTAYEAGHVAEEDIPESAQKGAEDEEEEKPKKKAPAKKKAKEADEGGDEEAEEKPKRKRATKAQVTTFIFPFVSLPSHNVYRKRRRMATMLRKSRSVAEAVPRFANRSVSLSSAYPDSDSRRLLLKMMMRKSPRRPLLRRPHPRSAPPRRSVCVVLS